MSAKEVIKINIENKKWLQNRKEYERETMDDVITKIKKTILIMEKDSKDE